MIICALLQLLVGLLDALFALLPEWDWTVAELPENGNNLGVTMWDQVAVGLDNLSPLHSLFLLMARMNKFVPVDQFISAVQFMASVITVVLVFRGLKWIINVVRGAGA